VRFGKAVEQDHRWPVGRAGDGDVEFDAGGKGDAL
jgi:hypothetical protein